MKSVLINDKRINAVRVLPIILILTALMLVACGGGDDDSAEATELMLPTEMVITDATEDVSQNPPPEETADDVPPIGDTPEPVIEETAPVDVPDGTQNPAPEVTEFVPPTADVNNEAVVQPDGGEVITDFSQLSGSVVGIFAGTLSVVADAETGQPNISLSDAQGNVLEVLIPPVFVDGLDNTAVELQGVASASVDNPDVFVLRASTVFVDGVEQTGSPADIVAPPPGVDVDVTSVAPQGPPVVGADVLDVQLDAGLTALQAYDALVGAVAESIAGYEWFVLSGNLELGWTLEFIEVETNSTQLYTVLPDGSVQVLASGNFVPPGTEVYLLDRELIVVDSVDLPVVDSQEAGGPPLGSPVFILQAGVEGQMFWTIQNSGAASIDATVVLED